VDFEETVINAIKTVIGEDVKIQGCFFISVKVSTEKYNS